MFKHVARLLGRLGAQKCASPAPTTGFESSLLSVQLPGSDATPAAAVSEIRLVDPLEAYLIQQGNSLESIAHLQNILKMGEVILETGCGSGEGAWLIASGNPAMGVIATDKYELAGPAEGGSYYRKVAEDWQTGRLKVQQALLPNLVVLRAESDIARYLPKGRVDSILLVNPEPKVAAAFVDTLETSNLLEHLKPGDRKIVIKPFSREMNVMSCGGYEFDHSEDWSCGLGFILGSSLPFKKVSSVQWSVDLSKASPYGRNSTQHSVYICGDRTAAGHHSRLAIAAGSSSPPRGGRPTRRDLN